MTTKNKQLYSSYFLGDLWDDLTKYMLAHNGVMYDEAHEAAKHLLQRLADEGRKYDAKENCPTIEFECRDTRQIELGLHLTEYGEWHYYFTA